MHEIVVDWGTEFLRGHGLKIYTWNEEPDENTPTRWCLKAPPR